MQRLPPNAARRSYEGFESILFTPFPPSPPPPELKKLFITGKQTENSCVDMNDMYPRVYDDTSWGRTENGDFGKPPAS